MPFARARDGTRIHYEVAGGGLGAPAVLLVMGLGLRGALWGPTRDALAAAGYRTVTFDNRGVGDTDAPGLSLTTETMADDAVTVMRAAFVARAHVVGTSLGGMVAQRLALCHARRVAALALQSTTAGMPRLDFVPAAGVARAAGLIRAGYGDRPPEVQVRAALRLLTTDDFAARADLTDPRLQLLLEALEQGVSKVGYTAQLRAAWKHRAWRQLRLIAAPTLVQHGAQDRVVTARAAAAIAKRIPGAQLRIYEGAGHLLGLQQPDSTDDLLGFLDSAGRTDP